MTSGPSIFFSWQSDTPADLGRDYVRVCLDEAVKVLAAATTIEEAPRVDSGMEGIAGSPEVATVMFEKIAASWLFVGDVTLVATGDALRKKRCPNPNVSIEMGFAAAILGWDRVVCVMNEAFGSRYDLPFDHRNRRFPITFSRKAGAESDSPALVDSLKIALQAADASAIAKVDRALRRLDLNCLRLMRAYGHKPHFSEPMLLSAEKIYEDLFPKAIPRLLDLGLLVSDIDGERSLYAYHWTHLGKKVVERIGTKLWP